MMPLLRAPSLRAWLLCPAVLGQPRPAELGFFFLREKVTEARNSVLGKHLWAEMNAPLTTTTYSTQDSEELVALPATSKLTNRGKGS